MAIRSLRKMLYSRAWDTRCRSVDVARVLKPLLTDGATLLDAGCGEYGLAEFISAPTVGIDILPYEKSVDGFTYIQGSIISLPFKDRSFTVAASVDVLEHLPRDLRLAAMGEVVRVAEKAVVIAFPTGTQARQADEDFRESLTSRGQPLPDWLDEHLQNPYPDTEDIVAAIRSAGAATGREATITIIPSERLSIAKLLRWTAARSRFLYLLTNLKAGILLPLLPKPTIVNSYRTIILAKFE